jgi:hypothetical protein
MDMDPSDPPDAFKAAAAASAAKSSSDSSQPSSKRMLEVQIWYLSSFSLFSWFGIFLFDSFNYSKGVINKAN